MTKSISKAPAQSLRWFRQARFGMFIHYGLYSILGRHEWALCYERIPFAEYRRLADRWRPKSNCASQWIALAKQTGMRYACLTTRHHEGFALFDTKASDFNSMNSPARRDLVREYVEACRRARLGVGLYYSVADWGCPAFVVGPKGDPQGWRKFVDTVHTQLRELMTHYGRIDYLFYDGCPPPKTWKCAQINAEIRRLQPHILLSSRCGLEEDVFSAEGHTIGDPGKAWETCMTSNHSWGYNSGDLDQKTPREVVQHLMTCCHNGGNFLFNIGPKGDGSIPGPTRRLLKEVGAWVMRNGEAVYGTDPHPFNYADQKLSTAKRTRAFVPLHYYHGPKSVIAGVGNRVKAARLLATGQKLTYQQDGDRVRLIGLTRKSPDPLLTIIALDLDAKPKGAPHPLLSGAKYH